MQQDVAGADRLHHVDAGGERGREPVTERRIGEVLPVHLARHRHQPHEVHRAVHLVEVFGAEAELLQQELGHLRRAVVGDLEADGVAEVPLRQLALQRAAQVLHVLLVDEEVAVARDPELVAAERVHAREELLHVLVQDRGQEHERRAVPVRELGRELDDPRQDARRLHDRDAGVAPERVPPLQLDGEVEALVEDAREGVRRIEPDRGQHRHHLAQEVVADPLRLRGGELAAAQELDALPLEVGKERVVQQPVLARDQVVRDAADRLKHLARGLAVRARARDVHLDLLLDAGDPDLEELVEVGRDDAEELQPLEQRHGRVLGLREHPPLELEQPELAVQEMALHVPRRRSGLDGHTRPQATDWTLHDCYSMRTSGADTALSSSGPTLVKFR